MKSATLSFVILVAVLVPRAQTQPPPLPGQATPAGAPAQGRGRGGPQGPQVVSPQVNPDKTVTLRFRAPNARSVELIGEIEGKPSYPMTKDEATGIRIPSVMLLRSVSSKRVAGTKNWRC